MRGDKPALASSRWPAGLESRYHTHAFGHGRCHPRNAVLIEEQFFSKADGDNVMSPSCIASNTNALMDLPARADKAVPAVARRCMRRLSCSIAAPIAVPAPAD